MKRRLILMRHAKSSWKEEGQDDHERPLNKRGRRDAPDIGERLAGMGWGPARVLLSDSQRTRETWSLMGPCFTPRPPAEEKRSLYLAGLEQIREEVGAIPSQVESVLVLGHNPGWEEAASALSGQAVSMTTANAALLEGEGASWSAALRGEWRLVEVLRPADAVE